MNYKRNYLLIVILAVLCLGTVGMLVRRGQSPAARQIAFANEQPRVHWTVRDYAEYVGWRLGIFDNPPIVYFADEIQKIRPESMDFSDQRDTVNVD